MSLPTELRLVWFCLLQRLRAYGAGGGPLARRGCIPELHCQASALAVQGS